MHAIIVTVVVLGALAALGWVMQQYEGSRAAAAQRAFDDQLRRTNPAAYARRMEEREAMDRLKLGLPADPVVVKRMREVAEAFKQAHGE